MELTLLSRVARISLENSLGLSKQLHSVTGRVSLSRLFPLSLLVRLCCGVVIGQGGKRGFAVVCILVTRGNDTT